MALDMLWRVLIAIVLFAAATCRRSSGAGCRRSRPVSWTPAQPLGFTPWQAQRHVVLPQVLGAVAPSLANSAIALFRTPPWSPS